MKIHRLQRLIATLGIALTTLITAPGFAVTMPLVITSNTTFHITPQTPPQVGSASMSMTDSSCRTLTSQLGLDGNLTVSCALAAATPDLALPLAFTIPAQSILHFVPKAAPDTGVRVSLVDETCNQFSALTSQDGTLNITCQVAVAPPACSVSASPSVLPAGGGTVTLTATCLPAPISGYSWTRGGTSINGASSTVTRSISATSTFTVAATNVAGQGLAASITVPVAVAVPVCTVMAAPMAIIRGGQTTLTANCSGAPTHIHWAGNALSATSGNKVRASPSHTSTFTVTASNSGGTSMPVAITVTVNPLVDPNPNCCKKRLSPAILELLLGG